MVVDDGGQQIVRQGNGGKIPREMQVDVFHGDDLRMTAAGGPSFHAEDRAE